jgi:hypothetical protein
MSLQGVRIASKRTAPPAARMASGSMSRLRTKSHQGTDRVSARLQSQGLSRHEALHASAFVVAQFIYELNNGQTAEEQASFQSRMSETIDQLHAEVWPSEAGRKS